jgi:hypothetical protein
VLFGTSTTTELKGSDPLSASVGLNPSIAPSGIERGLVDPVSQASSFYRVSGSSALSEEHFVPYSSSSSWWTDEAMERIYYEQTKLLMILLPIELRTV